MQQTDKALSDFNAWWDRQPFREQFDDVKDQMRNVWLASRRELVVELPEKLTCDDGYPSDDMMMCNEHNRAVDKCRAAIEAAGVTVRG